jgi:hypothetical protein
VKYRCEIVSSLRVSLIEDADRDIDPVKVPQVGFDCADARIAKGRCRRGRPMRRANEEHLRCLQQGVTLNC